MRINYNVTGPKRKALVAVVSQELNAPTKYLGAPTFAYEVGGYHIDKNGVITGPDNRAIKADLQGSHGFEAVECDYDEPDIYERGDATPAFEELQMTEGEELGLGKERREDFQGENGMQEDDCPETFTYHAELSDPNYDALAIELPKSGLTGAQVQNILKLVESKRALLTKALGRPLTVSDKGETLQFLYPYSEEAGVGIIYSQLATAFANYAKKHQRVTAKENAVESEKFAMRTFLVRLGMNGGEFSSARKWLCRNLSGNASFPNDASYAAMQASRRNGGPIYEQE